MIGWKPAECAKCGCSGLHACPGYRIPPPTPEDEARLENALRTIFAEVAREESENK